MALTLDSAQNIFKETQLPSQIPATIALFDQLGVDDKLAYLWYAYTEMGKTITPAAPGAARLQLAESLLDQIKKMSADEQTKVMQDLANRAETPISRSYGFFSVNTKLAFWFELGELMKQGVVAPIPPNYQMSEGVKVVLEATKKLDPGQQITVLRNTVVDMGFDTSKMKPSSSKPNPEPIFQRDDDAEVPEVNIDGITEPAVIKYIEAMNEDNFDAAIALFAEDGALQPPFHKPIVGKEAIAKYMREEAQGLNMMPKKGISESGPFGFQAVENHWCSRNTLVWCQCRNEYCMAVFGKWRR